MPPDQTRSSRRSALSCDRCRARKSKCIRLGRETCARCEDENATCVFTRTRGSRPFYQTSKEQYELMEALLHHFLPGLGLDTDSLRDALRKVESQVPPPSSLTPRSSRAAHSQPAFPAAPGSSSSIAPCGSSRDHESQRAVSSGCSEDGSRRPALPSPAPADVETAREGGKSFRDAMGVPRYDSGSSWATFYERVLVTLASRHGELLEQQPAMEDAMQDGRFVDVQCPREGLPSRTQTEEAFNTFFREISITVPILDYSQVRGILDNIYDQAASVSNAMLMILHLILAAESHVDSTSLKAADFFLKTVEEGTHESVQALVILALYYMNRDQRNVAWVIVGCAVRIARSLGMNLQERQDDEPLHYLERRKAIWWSVYMTDTFISCHLGRSSSIQDDGCFASAPSSSSWSANPWIPPGYDTESVALAVIENRILRKLYLERPSPKRYESTCTELLAAAQSWWSRLPDYLRPTCPTAPSYRRAIGHLGLRYYHSLMLITRRHLLEEIIYHSPSASRSERARICEQSNNDSIALAKTMAEQGLLGKFNYLDAFSIQSDGLILLVRVIKSPSAALAQEMVNLLPLLHLTEHLQSGRVAVKSYNAILAKLRPILIQEPSLGQNVDINAPHVDPTPSLDFGPALQDLWTDGDFFGAEGVDIMTAFDMGTF